MANTNYTYNELVTRVINDFDSIWTSLGDKGSVITDVAGSGNVATSYYSSIIDKLTYIKGSTGIHTAEYFVGGENATANNVSIVSAVNQTSNFKINATISTPGYYAAGAPITGTISAVNVNLATARTNGKWTLGTDGYSLTAEDLISGITAAQGKVENDGSIIAGTYDEKGNATEAPLSTSLGLEKDSSTNIIVDTAESPAYFVKVKANAGTTGTVSAKTVTTVTEGYVTAADAPAKTFSHLDIHTAANDDIVIGIQAGSIEVSSVEGTTATGSIAGSIVSSTNRGDDYEISATVEGVQLEATVTEGYVKQGETTVKINDISTTAGKKYIKKGTSKAQEIEVSDAKLKVTAGSEYLASEGKAVTITLDNVSAKAEIEEGYIKANEGGTISVTGTKTVKIAESTASASWNVSEFKKTGASIFSEGAGAYTLTVTPTVSVIPSATAGWIDGSSDISTGKAENSLTSVTYSVAAGSVKVDANPSFEVTLHDDGDSKNGQGTLEKIGDIFLETAPSTGDYFEVETKVGYTVTAGYVTASSGTPTTTRFMPKAVIEHVDNGEDGEDYYQVTKGGYLPSGVLSQISNVAPSLASVSVSLSSTTGVLSTGIAQGKTASDYHKIVVNKGVIDAGYISKTKGTLSGEAYIAKGHATATPSISAVKDSTIARKTADGVVKYEAKTTITANSNLNVTEGYITASEVDSAANKVTKTEDSIYEINRVVFGTTTHTTNASIDVDGGIVGLKSGEAAVYKVTPQIDSCSTQFTVSTAGYVSAADTDILKFTGDSVGHNGTMSSFAIHAGDGIASATEAVQTNVTANNDFASATGAYTITVGGKVSKEITLDEGYYGSSEKVINVETNVSKTVSVARGSVSASASGTNEITAAANGVTLHDTNTATGKEFYAINANANVTVSKSVTTAGYVRDAADITTTGTAPSDVAYVEAYKGNTRTGTAPDGTEQFTAIVIGQDANFEVSSAPTKEESVVLATAEKYSKKDTVVTLSAHAMGTSVVAEMARLEARLSGILTGSNS